MTLEQHQLRAYYRYLCRLHNNIPGDDKSDWFEIENAERAKQFIEAEERNTEVLLVHDDCREEHFINRRCYA